MRWLDGSLHTDQSAAIPFCRNAEDLPLEMRRRSLPGVRHFHFQRLSSHGKPFCPWSQPIRRSTAFECWRTLKFIPLGTHRAVFQSCTQFSTLFGKCKRGLFRLSCLVPLAIKTLTKLNLHDKFTVVQMTFRLTDNFQFFPLRNFQWNCLMLSPEKRWSCWLASSVEQQCFGTSRNRTTRVNGSILPITRVIWTHWSFGLLFRQPFEKKHEWSPQKIIGRQVPFDDIFLNRYWMPCWSTEKT